MTYVSGYGYSWYASLSSASNGHSLYFYRTGISPSYGISCTYGFPVRCLQAFTDGFLYTESHMKTGSESAGPWPRRAHPCKFSNPQGSRRLLCHQQYRIVYLRLCTVTGVWRQKGLRFGLRVMIIVAIFASGKVAERMGMTGFDSRQSLYVSMPSVVQGLVNLNAQKSNGNNSYALAA